MLVQYQELMSIWKSRPSNLTLRMMKNSNYFCHAVRPVLTTVLSYNRTMENKERFCMCILTKALSLVTLHFSSPYGEPTSIACSFIHSPGPRQHSYDLQRNTTSCYGERGSYYCEWQNYLQHKEKAFVNITIFNTAPSASKPIHSHSQPLVSLLELPCESPSHKINY